MANIITRTWTHKGIRKDAYQVSFYDQSGERRRKQFDKRSDAEKFIRKLEREGAGDVAPVTAGGRTIADVCERWLKACEKGLGEHVPVELSTLTAYMGHVENYIKPMIGARRLSEVTRSFCKQFRDDVLSKTSRENAKKVFTSFKSLLNEAVDAEWIIANPAMPVRIKISKRDKKRVEMPTKDEMRALLQKAEEQYHSNHPQIQQAWRRHRVLLMTFVFTGIRASELRGLSWPHVHLDRTMISITQRADRWNRIGNTKSASSTRDIEIPKGLVQLLREWRLMRPPSKDKLVFPNGAGHVGSIQNIHHRCWHPLQKRAGVVTADGKPKYTVHSIRHFYASMLIDRGSNPKEVQIKLVPTITND